MILPDNFKEIISKDKRRLESDMKPLILFEPVISEDSFLVDQNLDWELLDASEDGIEF